MSSALKFILPSCKFKSITFLILDVEPVALSETGNAGGFEHVDPLQFTDGNKTLFLLGKYNEFDS